MTVTVDTPDDGAETLNAVPLVDAKFMSVAPTPINVPSEETPTAPAGKPVRFEPSTKKFVAVTEPPLDAVATVTLPSMKTPELNVANPQMALVPPMYM